MSIFKKHPNTIFYDYTKVLDRLGRTLPENYDLTGSLSEDNREDCIKALGRGGRIAVVMNLGNRKGKKAKETPIFPTTWEGFRVVSGEENDSRYKDPSGVVVALTAKGDAVFDTSGFVICRGDGGITEDEQHLLHDPKTEGVKMRAKADVLAKKMQSFKLAEIHQHIQDLIDSKKKLLTQGKANPKTEKGDDFQVILHLSPEKEAGIINMCPLASLGCKMACLHTSGVAFQLDGKIRSRMVKTWYYALRREEFMLQLSKELTANEKKAAKIKKQLVARLNGTSDVTWEKVAA